MENTLSWFFWYALVPYFCLEDLPRFRHSVNIYARQEPCLAQSPFLPRMNCFAARQEDCFSGNWEFFFLLLFFPSKFTGLSASICARWVRSTAGSTGSALCRYTGKGKNVSPVRLVKKHAPYLSRPVKYPVPRSAYDVANVSTPVLKNACIFENEEIVTNNRGCCIIPM